MNNKNEKEKTSCPFCGTLEHYIGGSDARGSMFFVHCFNCGAKGPEKHSMLAAEQSWDKRKKAKVPDSIVNDLKKEAGLYNNG